MEIYCINCQKITDTKDMKSTTLINKSLVFKGKCKICNTEKIKKRVK